MNKAVLILAVICSWATGYGQATENEKLIELGKAYKNFMFANEPPKSLEKNLQTNLPQNLQLAANFILQTISTGNDLLDNKYLALPDNSTLKFIYIIHSINYNARKESPVDNIKLIDSLKAVVIPRNELIDDYYSILFASIGNKNKPFDLSKTDFDLTQYNLADDTEKGIFFLECISSCGSQVWGYMNIVKPPNTKKSLDLIKKFPKFNGMKYYQYTDFNFPDFEMIITTDEGRQSYKSFYLDKFYETLLSHLISLNREKAKEKEINDLLLGSILKEKYLYKYSKNKETLESLFKEVK
jgi:hypothetical protein